MSNRASQIREQVKKLQVSLNENYMGLADLLFEIWEEKYYLEYGYTSFYNYIETELDIKPRKAAYLVSIKRKMLKLGLDWEDVKDIGWRKLACISPILTTENHNEWIEKAKETSLRELSSMVKSGEPKDNVDVTARMVLVLDKDSLNIVQSAVDEAKHIWGTSSNSEAIKNICYEWYFNLEEQ